MNHQCLEHKNGSSPFPKSLLQAYPIKPIDTVYEQVGGQAFQGRCMFIDQQILEISIPHHLCKT